MARGEVTLASLCRVAQGSGQAELHKGFAKRFRKPTDLSIHLGPHGDGVPHQRRKSIDV